MPTGTSNPYDPSTWYLPPATTSASDFRFYDPNTWSSVTQVADPTFGTITDSNVDKVADSVGSGGGLPSWVTSILTIVKEIGLPALAIIKGSGVLKTTGSVADLANPANNANVDTASIEALKAQLELAAQKSAQGDTTNNTRKANIFGIEVDFSSPITWLFIIMLLFVLYKLFAGNSKRKKGFFNF